MSLIVSQSENGGTETSSKIVIGTEIKIGKHKYTSNWVLANSTYDKLLEKLWHTRNSPQTD